MTVLVHAAMSNCFQISYMSGNTEIKHVPGMSVIRFIIVVCTDVSLSSFIIVVCTDVSLSSFIIVVCTDVSLSSFPK